MVNRTEKVIIFMIISLVISLIAIIVYLVYDHFADIKTVESLNSSNVGLSNVDNTADQAKPVSNIQQLALNSKVDKTTTVNGYALSSNVQLSKTDIGLDKVDNTDDLNKPISNQQQIVNYTKSDKLTMICSINNYLRRDMDSQRSYNIQDFPPSDLGNESIGADYKIQGNSSPPLRCRYIKTVDGSWQSMMYLPNVSDYPKYVHFYFQCDSTFGTNVNTSRSDQTEYSSIPLMPGQLVVFVSTGKTWNYLGHLDV